MTAENFPSVAEWMSSGWTVSFKLEKDIEIYYPRTRSTLETVGLPGRSAAAGPACNIPGLLAQSHPQSTEGARLASQRL